MKNFAASSALVLVASTSLEGCRLVKGVFDIGVWAGVIIMIVLAAIVGGLFALVKG